jgi:hypothetical protein
LNPSLAGLYDNLMLHRLAESISRNRFLGSINVYKYGLWQLLKRVVSIIFNSKKVFFINTEQIKHINDAFGKLNICGNKQHLVNMLPHESHPLFQMEDEIDN